jgi:hypothetical protein
MAIDNGEFFLLSFLPCFARLLVLQSNPDHGSQ